MTIATVHQIADPSKEILDIWAQIANGLKILTEIQSNPKSLSNLVDGIISAHKLTAEELAKRESAVKELLDAKKDLLSVKDQHNDALKQIETDKKNYLLQIKSDTDAFDNYKTYSYQKLEQEKNSLASLRIVLDERSSDLDKREEEISKSEQKIKADQEEIYQAKLNQKEWEDEFSSRLAKLSAREKNLVKS